MVMKIFFKSPLCFSVVLAVTIAFSILLQVPPYSLYKIPLIQSIFWVSLPFLLQMIKKIGENPPLPPNASKFIQGGGYVEPVPRLPILLSNAFRTTERLPRSIKTTYRDGSPVEPSVLAYLQKYMQMLQAQAIISASLKSIGDGSIKTGFPAIVFDGSQLPIRSFSLCSNEKNARKLAGSRFNPSTFSPAE